MTTYPTDTAPTIIRVGAFYERHGFVEVRRTPGDNEEGEPDILYRWQPTAL